MSRITVPSFETAPAASQPMLEAVRKQLGVIPNMLSRSCRSARPPCRACLA